MLTRERVNHKTATQITPPYVLQLCYSYGNFASVPWFVVDDAVDMTGRFFRDVNHFARPSLDDDDDDYSHKLLHGACAIIR